MIKPTRRRTIDSLDSSFTFKAEEEDNGKKRIIMDHDDVLVSVETLDPAMTAFISQEIQNFLKRRFDTEITGLGNKVKYQPKKIVTIEDAHDDPKESVGLSDRLHYNESINKSEEHHFGSSQASA